MAMNNIASGESKCRMHSNDGRSKVTRTDEDAFKFESA